MALVAAAGLGVLVANPSALAQGLQGYNFMLTPDANSKLRTLQQETAMAEALRAQGGEPLDTKNRQIGGVGYAISPMEGAAKIAQQLVGAYGQYDSNKKFNDLMNPTPQAPADPTTPQAPPPDAGAPGMGVSPQTQGAFPGEAPPMPNAPPEIGSPGFAALPDAGAAPQQPAMPQQGPFSPMFTSAVTNLMKHTGMSLMDAMQIAQDPNALARVWSSLGPTPEMKNAREAYGDAGAPGAIRNIMNNQQFPGSAKYQEGLGTAAAGQAPAGTMPAGAGGPPMPGMQQGAVPPVNAAAIQPPPGANQFAADGSILLNAPPPGGTDGAGGSPPSAGAARTADLPPLNTAGMSNQQVQAAIDAQKAGAAKLAETRATNLGEAEKGQASIGSRMGAAKATLQKIIDLAPNTSSGMMIGTKEDFANQFNGKVAADNAEFTAASSRLFLQELPAVMASLSNRGNQFMERKIQEAGSIDLAMHPDAKVRVAKYLSDALDQAKEMQDSNVQLLGGAAAPAPAAKGGWKVERLGN